METSPAETHQQMIHALNMSRAFVPPWKKLLGILITLEVQLIIARFRGEFDEYSVAQRNDP